MTPDEERLAEIARERTEASDAIVNSTAEKRLIVAGPGTGKTYTFKKALEATAREDSLSPSSATSSPIYPRRSRTSQTSSPSTASASTSCTGIRLLV